jgi:hypothetical protein
MHDPMTVAHEIRWPWKNRFGSKPSIITIWHVDPETDGTDDSCGWFIRGRHADQCIREKIQKEFLFNHKHNYWFTKDGFRHFSTSGLLINMFIVALWQQYNGDRKKCDRYMRKHLHEILHFAENPTDCIGDTITGKYGVKIDEETICRLADTVYTYILRDIRPWWKHPRWHIHHWKIRFHPWQNFKRRYLLKCCKCGKRGFKSSPISDWAGTRHWHQHCQPPYEPAPKSESNG